MTKSAADHIWLGADPRSLLTAPDTVLQPLGNNKWESNDPEMCKYKELLVH